MTVGNADINVIVVCCLIEVLPVQVDTIIEEDEENTIKGRIHLSGLCNPHSMPLNQNKAGQSNPSCVIPTASRSIKTKPVNPTQAV